jgi:hypothetical protein
MQKLTCTEDSSSSRTIKEPITNTTSGSRHAAKQQQGIHLRTPEQGPTEGDKYYSVQLLTNFNNFKFNFKFKVMTFFNQD